jgi:TetR/AcrR family transcriptional repressor of nem operon
MPKVETFNKEFVLKQAIEVFHGKGYNATSMQDLVDATGLNRSSIYNSFDSKLNLFMECLKAYHDKYSRETSKVLLKATSSIHAIELIFDLYLKEIIKDKFDRGCMITNCKSEMANHEGLITNFLNMNQQSTIALLEDLVARGQEETLINNKKTPNEYALYLYSSLQGFRMTGILITDKTQLQSIVKTILQTLI